MKVRVIKSNLTLGEYINKIKTYFRNIIIDLQNSDTWKIQLRIAINFISSKDVEQERKMDLNSSNIKFTSCNDADEAVNELIESLRLRYQDNLETSIKCSNFVFDSVQLTYYNCHKAIFKRGGSNTDSLDWIKNKKSNNKSKK